KRRNMRICGSRGVEALDSPNEESFNNHSSSLSPNSSPSPPRSGGGCSGGSSDSSTGSTIRHSWKKRYCEMNQSTSYLHKMESSEPSNKKKRMNTQFISDEDSGVNSSAASSASLTRMNDVIMKSALYMYLVYNRR
ncbi:Hypothetical protein FKW44_018182, partial [Caligus rogercresseyi]